GDAGSEDAEGSHADGLQSLVERGSRDGVGDRERRATEPGTGRGEADEDLAGVRCRARGRGGETARAGVAGDAVVPSGGGGEVDRLIDHERNGQDRARAADGCVREMQIAAQLAGDVVERVDDEELCEVVECDTARSVEWRVERRLAVLAGAIGAGGSAGQASDE